MKVFANERGLTLIELLVGLAITSIIAASAYGVFTAGMKAYKRIGIENQLRSEADILMTTIFNELYALAPDGLKIDESNDDTLTFVNEIKKEIDTNTGLVEDKKQAGQTLQIMIDKTNVYGRNKTYVKAGSFRFVYLFKTMTIAIQTIRYILNRLRCNHNSASKGGER